MPSAKKAPAQSRSAAHSSLSLTPEHAIPNPACEVRGMGGRRTVEDFVTGLTPRELAEINRELRPDETVRWATRPLLSRWDFESTNSMIGGLVGCVFMLFITMYAADALSLVVALIFPLPMWCCLFWAISSPMRRLRRLRRTLYFITNQRALVAEPVRFGWKVRSWPLKEGMILFREADQRNRNHGSLVFSLEQVVAIDFRTHTERLGFLCLTDLQRAEQEICSAVEAQKCRVSCDG